MRVAFAARRRRSTRAASRRALLLLVLCLATMGTVIAQSGLPQAAAAALAAAQRAAAEAIATYVIHYPDQPLWRTAIEEGERAKALAPGRTEPLRFLAQAYGTTGWTARTWQTWQEYIDLGGTMDARSRRDAAQAALTLGYQAFSVGALDNARELLSAANSLSPGDSNTAAYLGQTELALGNAQAAAPLLATAVETFPQLRQQLQRAQLGANHGLEAADAYVAAEARMAAGDAVAALMLYNSAIATAPNFTDAIRGAAVAHGALGQTELARARWERLAELSPEDSEALEVLARFQAADDAAAAAAAAAEATQAALAAAEQAAQEAAAQEAEAAATAPAVTLTPEPQVSVIPPEPEPAPEPQPTPQPSPEPAPQPQPPEVAEPEPPPVAVPAGPALTLLDATLSPRAPAAGGEGAFTFLAAPAAAVGNLDEPFDYGSGTLHLRVEVVEKPTSDPVLLQLCLVPDDLITVAPACSSAANLRLSGPGVVTATQSVSGMEGSAAVDWSQGMAQLIVVLRDTNGLPLDPRYATDESGRPLDVSFYYPLTFRISAVLVPAGGAFGGW